MIGFNSYLSQSHDCVINAEQYTASMEFGGEVETSNLFDTV